MNQINVAVIVGNLGRDSINRRLARAVERLAPAEWRFAYIRIDDLPLYSPRDLPQSSITPSPRRTGWTWWTTYHGYSHPCLKHARG